YVSFLLDGEMAEAHPELVGKPTRIELRCAHMPDSRALELLGLIHDQLDFQEIKMEVAIRNDETRVSNDEGMTKSECRSGYRSSCSYFRAPFVLRHFWHRMRRGARS